MLTHDSRFSYLTRQYWDAVAAITAVASLGYGVYSGEEGRATQKTGMRRQQAAQNQAQSQALRQQKLAAEANAKANAKAPDISSLLAFEQQPGGLNTSLLYGGGNRTSPRINRPTLLGEQGGGY